MNYVSRPQLTPEINLEVNAYVTMRDGVKIAVDIYSPIKKGQYPGILSMSPYPKEIQLWPPVLTHSIEAGNTRFFASKGYVHVIANVRGTGMSQGQFDIFSPEQQQDGAELVEWIATQPWCNGNVGMLGDSYFAIMQNLVATQQPPHLKCIVPCDASSDFYRDYCHKGGLFNSGFFGNWGPDTIALCLWPGPVEGKLPPRNFINDMLQNTEDGPYWWKSSYWTRTSDIKVPVLSIVPQPSTNHSRGQLAAYPNIKSPKKLIVMPGTAASGTSNVYFIESTPLNEYILKWFDYWLKGINNGIMDEPEVAICDSITNEWRYENEYPIARTQWTKFYLRANPTGPANNPPYGLLSLDAPGDEKPDKYFVGTRSPGTQDIVSSMTPESTNRVNTGKPVLGYATPPLEKDIKISGPISATLYGSSTTRDTAWFVRLGDMAPDGKVTLMTMGVLKASHRAVDPSRSKAGQPFHPHQSPTLPEPNKVYEYQIELTPKFWTFRKGHKIWIQIASDDNSYMLSLHTIFSTELLPIPAENTVYHDGVHLSHLILPVITDASIIKPVGEPLINIKWPPS